MSAPISFDRVRSSVVVAIDRLKDKFPAALKIDDVINYTFSATQSQDATTIKFWRHAMAKSPEVELDDVNKTYQYKPPYDIKSAEELIKFFQNEDHVQSISVDQLRKGWAECDDAINNLAKERKLIVQRGKKDNNAPKWIWPDDPDLFAEVDQEFIDLSNGVELPSKDDIIRYLEKSGRTPAGQVVSNNGVSTAKAKVRKLRQSTKQTNVHMKGLFKDYSNLRQKGK